MLTEMLWLRTIYTVCNQQYNALKNLIFNILYLIKCILDARLRIKKVSNNINISKGDIKFDIVIILITLIMKLLIIILILQSLVQWMVIIETSQIANSAKKDSL